MASKSMQRTTPRDACGRMTASDQLQPLQTRMPVLADDDVIVHGNAERGGDLDDRLGDVDIGLRRRRVAGGVVVQKAVSCTDGWMALFATVFLKLSEAARCLGSIF